MTTGDEKDDSAADTAGRSRSGVRPNRPAWLQTLIAVPAAVLPLLPSFSCPVCVAAYAGLLSSLGLGFLLTDRVQRPLIVAFLIVSVAGVGWAGRQYQSVGPSILVLLGSAAIIAGRLVWSVTPALYVGVVCLVAGTVWNMILKRPRRNLVSLGVVQKSECNQ
ncbi:MAG: MerC domain-containing protein [Planctomycetes bacterium]|nr:MerC domain-containing protein [Planctomycetota bacterium]